MTARGRWAGILVAAGFIAATVVVSLLQPSDEFQQSPFVTRMAGFDIPSNARAITVTATDAALADRVQTPDWLGDTEGVWLVVDLTFEPRIDRGGIAGEVRIGDTVYRASQRVESGIDSAIADPGLPWAGALLFELPASVLDRPEAGTTLVRFSSRDDTRLDEVLELVIDLGSLPHEASLSVPEPGRVTG